MNKVKLLEKIQKVIVFYNTYRQVVLTILDWVQGILMLSQIFLPEGRLRLYLGSILAAMYTLNSSRYYRKK
jgi:hypothetical protein